MPYYPPAGSSGRRLLTANETWYVRTTGSDITGDGSAASPWATVQKAWDYISISIDTSGFTATIDIGAGTFASFFAPSIVGGGTVKLSGAGKASTTLNGAIFYNSVGTTVSFYSCDIVLLFNYYIYNNFLVDGTCSFTNNGGFGSIQLYGFCFLNIGFPSIDFNKTAVTTNCEIYVTDGANIQVNATLNVVGAGHTYTYGFFQCDGGINNIEFFTSLTGTTGGPRSTVTGNSVLILSLGAGTESAAFGTIGTSPVVQINGGRVVQTTSYYTYGPIQVSKTANYSIFTAEAGTVYDNVGAGSSIAFTLPVASRGLAYSFCCGSSHPLYVTSTGAQICLGTFNSTGGTISSTSQYSFVGLEAISSIQWVANSVTGSWLVT